MKTAIRSLTLLALLAGPAFAQVPPQPTYEMYAPLGVAIFDTTITNTTSSVDTVYFGGMAVGPISGEVSATGGIQLAWHQDWKAVAGYGKLNTRTITNSNKRRAGQLYVLNTKKWAVGAGKSFSYVVPVSACVITGVVAGTVHIQTLVWVK